MAAGVQPKRPCGDCGHGDSRHRGDGSCRNPGCECRGYVPKGKRPVGSSPPLIFARALPPAPPAPPAAASAPPSDAGGSAALLSGGAEAKGAAPPETDAAGTASAGPPPIDVPAGETSSSSSGPGEDARAAELRERQRKAEMLAATYCAWLKHAQTQLRDQGAPLTLSDGIIDDMVYPAAVRIVLREGISDKVSSEDMDNAMVIGPGALTLWFKYQAWKESKKGQGAAAAPRAAARAAAAAAESSPPPPPPRPAEPATSPDGEIRI